MTYISQMIILAVLMVGCSDESLFNNGSNAKIPATSSQKTTLSNVSAEWVKLGKAFMGTEENLITVGQPYNIMHTEEYGDIHLRYGLVRDREIIETSPNSIKYTPIGGNYGGNHTEILVQNIKLTDHSASFSFKVNSTYYQMEGFEPGVFEATDPEYVVNCGILCWKKIVKDIIIPIILDQVTEELTKGEEESCTDQAIRACGVGNVDSVSDYFWGCSYSCD